MPPRNRSRQQAAPAAPQRVAPQIMIPFTAAAHEHREPVTVDNAGALGAAQNPRGPFDIPSYGFIKSVLLEVSLTGGTLGAGVLAADFPFNILQNIQITDVNGAPIFGPLDGYATL